MRVSLEFLNGMCTAFFTPVAVLFLSSESFRIHSFKANNEVLMDLMMMKMVTMMSFQ